MLALWSIANATHWRNAGSNADVEESDLRVAMLTAVRFSDVLYADQCANPGRYNLKPKTRQGGSGIPAGLSRAMVRSGADPDVVRALVRASHGIWDEDGDVADG